jgi:hypothetical protein
MEFGKPHAYRGPICTSGDCQLCGEPYFAGAAISIDDFMPQIPKRDKHKSNKSNQCFVEGQFNVSA